MSEAQKKKIVAWWVFYQLDIHPLCGPEDILRFMKEAESDPKECDFILSREYKEYQSDLDLTVLETAN